MLFDRAGGDNWAVNLRPTPAAGSGVLIALIVTGAGAWEMLIKPIWASTKTDAVLFACPESLKAFTFLNNSEISGDGWGR